MYVMYVYMYTYISANSRERDAFARPMSGRRIHMMPEKAIERKTCVCNVCMYVCMYVYIYVHMSCDAIPEKAIERKTCVCYVCVYVCVHICAYELRCNA